ncbi:MAG: SigF/SigG family RNA polymerase sporulation sigma factor [Velocimicrobium sp.]
MENVQRLITEAQGGDKDAREQLILDNMALVWSIVRRFSNRGYEAQDLFQIGSIGLIKAIDKFDISFEVKFSTYAVPMISGEIKRFLRDDGMIKMSRSIKENGWKVRRSIEKLAYLLGRDATLTEIAEDAMLSLEEVVMALEANVEVESIYKTIYQGEGNEITLEDKLPSENDESEKIVNHMLMEQLLELLSEDERELIHLRYYQDKTQTEVAKRLGVSQVQVSRLEKKILKRMRNNL